ncbi:MAG: tetratricopeptide repeat protein [Syntrophaceae bacterium]
MSNTSIYRYPGPVPFQDTHANRLLFHGRNHERETLKYMVLAERLVVLYAKSGLGKTSLINAGIMQPLREKNILPIRITFTDITVDPQQAVYSKITDIVKEYQIDYKPGESTTLWQYFQTVEFWSTENILYTPLLIFDQFEELFTLHSSERRKNFFNQLADLVRGRIPKILFESLKSDEPFPYSEKPPDVKVLISIREDFLGQLEEMSQEIPDILHKRFRLLTLHRNQAEEAIIKPSQVEDVEIKSVTFKYTTEAVKAILDFLCKRKEKGESKSTDEVEPFQLQVICQHIESNVNKRAESEETIVIIQESDLGGEEGMQKILTDFYNDKISKLGSIWVQSRVRKLFEKMLISDTGRRVSLEEEQIERKARVSKSVLLKLVDNRLLRAEPRVGSIYYELSHDTLIEPIHKSNREYKRKQLIVRFLIGLLIVISLIGIDQYKTWRNECLMIDKYLEDINSIEENRGIGEKKKERIDAAMLFNDPYRQLTFIYAKQGKDDKAFDVCNRASNKKTALSGLWGEFFNALKLYRKQYQAEKFLDDIASKFSSQDPEYYYYLALEFYNIKNYEKEFENYQKAIALDPKYANAYFGLGDNSYDQGKYDEAIRYYNKAIEINPNYIDAIISIGNTYYNRGKYNEAIQYYKKAIDVDPNNFNAIISIGNAYFNRGKYNEAIQYYKKAIEINPNDINAIISIGNTYFNRGKYDEAIQYYKKAIEINPNDIDAIFNIGSAYFSLGKHDEAIQYYKKAIEFDPKNIDTIINTGNTYYNLGKYDEAIQFYETVIEVSPRYTPAYTNLAYIFKLQNKPYEIRRYVQETIKMNPYDAALYTTFGNMYSDVIFDYQEAYEFHKKAYELAPDNIFKKANLAEASLEVEEFTQASRLASKVLGSMSNKTFSEKCAMWLVSISSSLFLNERDQAYEKLIYLTRYLKNVGQDYSSNWSYSGYKNFVSNTSKLANPDKELILKLIDILESPKPESDRKLKELESQYPEIFTKGSNGGFWGQIFILDILP